MYVQSQKVRNQNNSNISGEHVKRNVNMITEICLYLKLANTLCGHMLPTFLYTGAK